MKDATSHALVKGALFYPYEAWCQNQFESPVEIDTSHDKGWWIHLGSFQKVAIQNRRWRILPKSDWLSPAIGGTLFDSSELLTKLTEKFNSDSRAVLLGLFDKNDEEKERGFVVPNDWAPCPAS